MSDTFLTEFSVARRAKMSPLEPRLVVEVRDKCGAYPIASP